MDKIINSINEDLKHNGIRKWLLYLKMFFKLQKKASKKQLDYIRDKVYENYKKEEGYSEK